MTYVSWALFAEGNSDYDYLEVLIPRVIEHIALRSPRPVTIPQSPALRLGSQGRAVDSVAKEACDSRDAFHLLFIHADTGGRETERTLDGRSAIYVREAFGLCGLRQDRCVLITPRHETEAWVISDSSAVAQALGFSGDLNKLGLPRRPVLAERVTDPKGALTEAVIAAVGERGAVGLLPLAAIAQRQDLRKLQRLPSFRWFEDDLIEALGTLGIAP